MENSKIADAKLIIRRCKCNAEPLRSINFYQTTKNGELTKNVSVSRGMEPSSYLKNDSIYQFQLCINVNELGTKHRNYQKEGEYVVWIRYYYGDCDLISNKIKLYFKSSLKK